MAIKNVKCVQLTHEGGEALSILGVAQLVHQALSLLLGELLTCKNGCKFIRYVVLLSSHLNETYPSWSTA